MVAPREDERRDEKREGHGGPGRLLAPEGANGDRGRDERQEEEKGESYVRPELTKKAAPEEERGRCEQDEEDPESWLQETFRSLAAIFAITL